jgi:hypothetical protein
MATKLTGKAKLVGGDLFVEAWEEGHDPIRVTVSREAIADFCDPRGISYDADKLPAVLLEALIEAVDRLTAKSGDWPTEITIETKDLNG